MARYKLREQEKAVASRILTREQQRDRIQCAELLAERYKKALDSADFQLRQQIINALVAKVTIHPSRVRVELRLEKPLTQEVKPVFAGENEIQKPLYGAMGGTRTLNPVRERDFESRAYTIPPPWLAPIVAISPSFSTLHFLHGSRPRLSPADQGSRGHRGAHA